MHVISLSMKLILLFCIYSSLDWIFGSIVIKLYFEKPSTIDKLNEFADNKRIELELFILLKSSSNALTMFLSYS